MPPITIDTREITPDLLRPEDSPVLAGMLRKVRHLVKVEDAT